MRIGIIGPESTGKSTLAHYLAQRYDGILIPEYAREYVEQLPIGQAYTRDDVLKIAQQQVEELRNLANQPADRLIVFDTELIITKVWMMHKWGECPDFLEKALHDYPMDVYLLCYPDLDWVLDPVRENPTIREYLYDWYEREIHLLDIPYYIVRHI